MLCSPHKPVRSASSNLNYPHLHPPTSPPSSSSLSSTKYSPPSSPLGTYYNPPLFLPLEPNLPSGHSEILCRSSPTQRRVIPRIFCPEFIRSQFQFDPVARIRRSKTLRSPLLYARMTLHNFHNTHIIHSKIRKIDI